MDEASSRYVDRIVLEKLLNEKLSKVRHICSLDARGVCPTLPCMDEASVVCARDEQSNSFRLRSPLPQTYAENQWFRVLAHEVNAARGALVLVHGLFEDNRELYRFLIGELNRLGYSVFVTTLPYHYERVPKQSRFSGEFFLSADLARTAAAFQTAVIELEMCQRWLCDQLAQQVFVVGFSMGATVALLLAARQVHVRGTFVINPASNLPGSIWTSPLCEHIRNDLLAAGLDQQRVTEYLRPICPVQAGLREPTTVRVRMARALYDLVTTQGQYDTVASLLPSHNVIQYKAGHLNTLRVPRLAQDIVTFFDELSIPRLSQNDPT